MDLQSLYWWEFYNISRIPHLPILLSHLTDLKLTFQVESFDRPSSSLRATCRYWKELEKYVPGFRNHLHSVEQLWLGFDSFPGPLKIRIHQEPVCLYAQRRFSNLMLQASLSGSSCRRLKNLTLKNLVTNVDDFSGFIRRYGKRLESLTLMNMCLDVDKNVKGCVIRDLMLKIVLILYKHLNLEDMVFQGVFRQHNGSALVCKSLPGSTTLHHIQEVICHRRLLYRHGHAINLGKSWASQGGMGAGYRETDKEHLILILEDESWRWE
jgi:hypothetical protein